MYEGKRRATEILAPILSFSLLILNNANHHRVTEWTLQAKVSFK